MEKIMNIKPMINPKYNGVLEKEVNAVIANSKSLRNEYLLLPSILLFTSNDNEVLGKPII